MSTCPCRACIGPSGLALLHGQVLDVLHECVRRYRTAIKVRPPIRWAGRQNHIFTLFANENFVGAELELLRQPHSLAAIVHEHLGSSLHGLFLPRTGAVYISICHVEVSRNGPTELYQRAMACNAPRHRWHL